MEVHHISPKAVYYHEAVLGGDSSIPKFGTYGNERYFEQFKECNSFLLEYLFHQVIISVTKSMAKFINDKILRIHMKFFRRSLFAKNLLRKLFVAIVCARLVGVILTFLYGEVHVNIWGLRFCKSIIFWVCELDFNKTLKIGVWKVQPKKI